MEVEFRNNKLELCYTKSSEAIRKYGDKVAKKYVLRINTIKEAKNFDEIQKLPGLNCHPLKGDRKGQFAIKLTGFYRLIFTITGEQLNITMIEEVSKHYDD